MMLLAAGTAKKHIVSMKGFNAGVQAAARKIEEICAALPCANLGPLPSFQSST